MTTLALAAPGLSAASPWPSARTDLRRLWHVRPVAPHSYDLARVRQAIDRLRSSVALADVAARLDARGMSAEQLIELESRGVLDDVVLACACACGDRGALERLDEMVKGIAAEHGRRLQLSASERDDVAQRLTTRLLTGSSPALASYDGRGALRAWLRVCLAREALTLRRLESRHATRELSLSEAVEPLFDPELRLLEADGRSAVKAAFEAAFGELSARDRMLLAYAVVDGLTVREIGSVVGIDASNVSRQLARIRRDLLAGTRRSLTDARGLGEASVDDVLSLLDSQLDLSISRLLIERRPSTPTP